MGLRHAYRFWHNVNRPPNWDNTTQCTFATRFSVLQSYSSQATKCKPVSRLHVQKQAIAGAFYRSEYPRQLSEAEDLVGSEVRVSC